MVNIVEKPKPIYFSLKHYSKDLPFKIVDFIVFNFFKIVNFVFLFVNRCYGRQKEVAFPLPLPFRFMQ